MTSERKAIKFFTHFKVQWLKSESIKYFAITQVLYQWCDSTFKMKALYLKYFPVCKRGGKIWSLKMWEYLHLIHVTLYLIKCLKIKCGEEICVERGCKHWINLPIFYSDHKIKCPVYENIEDIQTPFFLIKRFSPLIMLKENKFCYFSELSWNFTAISTYCWTGFSRLKGAWFSCYSCSHFNAQCHERTVQWKYKNPSLLHMYGFWVAETKFCLFVKLGLHQIYPSTIVRKEKCMLNETFFKKFHLSTPPLMLFFLSVLLFSRSLE